MDLVSIIIPYYRKKSFFKDAINSVKSQTYRNLEIIVVFDDNNPDEYEFIKKNCINDKRIKIIKNNKNKGAPYSRNLGIKISKGKYIAFIDCDDKWKKNKISTQINFMKKKKIKFCFTSYNLISENGKTLGVMRAENNIYYNDLIYSCDIGLSTVIIKKKLFLKYKFSSNKTKEDYSLWLKLSRKKNIYGLNKELSSWRKLDNSLSSNTLQKIFDAFDIYYRQEKFNFIISITRVIILSFNFLKNICSGLIPKKTSLLLRLSFALKL